MLEIRLYTFPTVDEPEFQRTAFITTATNVMTLESFFDAGKFNLTIPVDARYVSQIMVGNLLHIDRSFWGIIDDVHFAANATGDDLMVYGRQLKGLTTQRITVPPIINGSDLSGTQGYDVVNGYTETCMKHFVAANMTGSTNRAIVGLTMAPDQQRGFAADKYMSRHQPLHEVLKELGEASSLGYDIVPNLESHSLIFDVIEGADRTTRQYDYPPIVFDIERKTVQSQEYKGTISNSRNVFYTTMSGAEFADEALTLKYYREGEYDPAGIDRREMHMTVSANTPHAGQEYEELERLALIQAEGYRPEQTFSGSIIDTRYQYGKDYFLGDKVSIQNKKWGVVMHSQVTAMQTDYSSSGIQRTATFGSSPLSIAERLKKQIKQGS